MMQSMHFYHSRIVTGSDSKQCLDDTQIPLSILTVHIMPIYFQRMCISIQQESTFPCLNCWLFCDQIEIMSEYLPTTKHNVQE